MGKIQSEINDIGVKFVIQFQYLTEEEEEEEELKSFYIKAFKKFSLNRENENMLVFTRD